MPSSLPGTPEKEVEKNGHEKGEKEKENTVQRALRKEDPKRNLTCTKRRAVTNCPREMIEKKIKSPLAIKTPGGDHLEE